MNQTTIANEGQKAIHYAAKHNIVRAMQILIEYGASPVEKDAQLRTPLFVAAKNGNETSNTYVPYVP